MSLPVGARFPIAVLAVSALFAPCLAWADEVDVIYECAMALDQAEKWGHHPAVAASHARAHFLKTEGAAAEPAARQAVESSWADMGRSKGDDALRRYVLDVAADCADLYQQVARMKPAAQSELNSQGTLAAASLRAYVEQTGDAAGVADYLVYHYPYGKDLFAPNEDGDYLGELIAAHGPAGIRRFSTEAIYAIEHNRYWQYNPPATRIVQAEYFRRLRAQRQTADEGRRWAERAAADRAQQARQANAKPVGSIGRSCEIIYRPAEPGIPGSRVTKCR